jgi:hypothetical protein
MTNTAVEPAVGDVLDNTRPLAAAKAIPLDRGEFARFCAGLGLDAPSTLSPLASLTAESGDDTGRGWNELRAPIGAVADATMAYFLAPLVRPDRILDARATVYEGAPTPCRLMSSRRAGAGWAGLRPAVKRDYEIVAPYTDGDLVAWADAQFALSARAEIGSPWDELSGEELAFLLALFDAHATALHRSFVHRRPTPAPATVRFSDVIEAQNEALLMRDRRFLLTMVTELFDVMVHAGGRQGLTLAPVTPALAEREVRRYVQRGWLAVTERGRNPVLRLEPPLLGPAFTLLSWLTVLSLHDLQVVGHRDGHSVAQEEAALFFVTEAAVWGLVCEGMTTATDDLGQVRFALRTLNALAAPEAVRRFLVPIETGDLPDAVYRPASRPAKQPVIEPPRAAVVPPPPPPAPAAPGPAPGAPAWTATHLVPDSGMPAWTDADGSVAPVARLDARLPVRLAEHRADGWGHIECANGWQAWVDARQLLPINGAGR